MEKLIINVPEEKSALVKALLKELGVTMEQEKIDREAYLKKITEIPVWSDEEVRAFEEATKTLNNLSHAQ